MISRMKKSISSGNRAAQNPSESDFAVNTSDSNWNYRRSRSVGRLRVRSNRGVSPPHGSSFQSSSSPIGVGGASGQNDERKNRGHEKKQKQKRGNVLETRDRQADGDQAAAEQQSDSKNSNSNPSEAKAPEEKVEGSMPDTLVTFEKNRSTLKKLKQSGTCDGVNVTLPSLTVEQVMLLSVSPPGKSSELHHMIDGRQWTAVRIKLKLLKGDQTPKKLTSAGVAASATNINSVTDVKPIKSSTSLMKALLQRDELGRTPLHLILQRRSTGTSINGTLSMKKAPPDIIVGLLHSCPRASSIPDIENNYPLHIAVLNGHRTDIVRLLVHCYPGALLETNVNLDTPLILAANFSISLKPSTKDNGNQSPKIVTPHSSPQAVAASLQNKMLNDDEVRIAFATSPRWELVSLFLQHHPESAQIRNSHDMSVLEMALQRHAPAHVIRMLLRADKSAASIQRRVNLRGGDTFNDRNSSDAIGSSELPNRSISESSNLGINVGVMTPLNLAIMRHAGAHILGLVALAFPSALHVRDQWGLGAVAKCWIDWYYENSEDDRRAIRREKHVQLLANLVQARNATSKLHPSLVTVWTKIQTLLCVAHHPDSIKNRNFHDNSSPNATKSTGRDGKSKAAASGIDPGQDNTTDALIDPATSNNANENTDNNEDIDELPVVPPFPYTFRPVHAAASHDCPLEILNLALVLYPNQCTQRDEQGSTPLHLAAAAPLYTKQSFEPPLIPPIERLIRMDPGAACMTDSCGRLPLHIAVDTGKKWHEGVSALVAAEPRALNSPDPYTTGLYPALSAASRARTTPLVTPTTGYMARNRAGEQGWNSLSEREKEEEILLVRHEEDMNSLTTVFELLRFFPLVVSKTLREKEESISCLALIDGPTTENAKSPSLSTPENGSEKSGKRDEFEGEMKVQVQHGVPDWSVDDAKNNLMFAERPSTSGKSVKPKEASVQDTTGPDLADDRFGEELGDMPRKDSSNMKDGVGTDDLVEGEKRNDNIDRSNTKRSRSKSQKRRKTRRHSSGSYDPRKNVDPATAAASDETMDPEGERVIADFGNSKTGYNKMKSIVARGVRENLRARSARCVTSSKTSSDATFNNDMEKATEGKDLLQVDAAKLIGESQNMDFLTPQCSASHESEEENISSQDIQNDVINESNYIEKKKKLVSLPKFPSRSSSNAAAKIIDEVDGRDEKIVDEGVADWSLQDIQNNRPTATKDEIDDMNLNAVNENMLQHRQSNDAGAGQEANAEQVDSPSKNLFSSQNESMDSTTPFNATDETGIEHAQGRVDFNEAAPDNHTFPVDKASPDRALPLATSTRLPRSPYSDFKENEDVLYRDSKGNVVKATVIKVHFDDELEPYYDIRLASGKEKQTDDNHLTKFALSPTKSSDASEPDTLKTINPFAKDLVHLAGQELDKEANPFDAFASNDPSIQPLDLFSDYEDSGADDNPFEISDDAHDGQGKILEEVGTESNDTEALPSILICTSCNENKRDVVILPCRHLCVCFTCSLDVRFCPVCGQDAKNTLHVIF